MVVGSSGRDHCLLLVLFEIDVVEDDRIPILLIPDQFELKN